MIRQTQYRKLMQMIHTGHTLKEAALKSGVDEKTARKYKNLEHYPPCEEKSRSWRTRSDPFEEVWEELEGKLVTDPKLEAKTLFLYLQEKYPCRFQDYQLRTLQRKVKRWRALRGPLKEIFFSQRHRPGELGESDFTQMNDLGITIQTIPFPHLLYHFVLTYSNWESITLCFSENFESFSEGIQNALWQLGGAPQKHRSDRLSAAVKNFSNRPLFAQRYEELLNHYGLQGQAIQTGKPHENGDVEQQHYRLKKRVDQALMMRGSRDFKEVEEYRLFLREIVQKANTGRAERFKKEVEHLKPLPPTRLVAFTKEIVHVTAGSTIRVKKNSYSVPSRLIGEKVEVRIYGSHIEVWYAQEKIESLPRLVGNNKAKISYHHLIDWLIRKPGAFEHYRYREELFPTTSFRTAYDILCQKEPASASKEYLRLLYLAAKTSEAKVETALQQLIRNNQLPYPSEVEALVSAPEKIIPLTDVAIAAVDLQTYDTALLENVYD